MKIELPHVGESVTEGTIDRWLKRVGDRVEKYDPLAEVVTDKVNMEVPSPVSGVLTSILVEEGTTVLMGTVIAEVQVEGEEDAGDQAAPMPAEETPAEPVDRIGTLDMDAAPFGPTGSGGPAAEVEPAGDAGGRPQRYSPAVRRLAAEHGVDLSAVTGTGIGGRVTRNDVEAYVSSSPEAPSPRPATGATADERVPLTPVRRIIAENMVRSATQIPHVWTMVEVDVTGLVGRRNEAKEQVQEREGVRLTYLAFVLREVSQSLRENPLLNSTWDGDGVVLKGHINIGIAVAAPAGLVVPVIRDADLLSVVELARAIEVLTGKARQGKLDITDVQGGTFTVNNTGALGSVISQPIINPSQAAIVTTEAIVRRPVAVDEAIAIRSIMNVCLSFDHRILDGAEAGAFLAAVKRALESIGPDTPIY